MSRWIRFFIVFGIGLIIALFYTWKINPVQLKDTSPDTLRQDYKTDYVLMVAEIYHANGDLETARMNLALLGSETPDKIVEDALDYARGGSNNSQALYPAEYVALMQALSDAIKTLQPTLLPTPENP